MDDDADDRADPAPSVESARPPVVIVRHRKEKVSKCSLEPLRGREGFVFLRYPQDPAPPLDGYVRLSVDGPLLSRRADGHAGILLLDATWRLVEPMERLYAHVPPRRLPPLRTAYPRCSKLFEDPQGGLASIEALYVALAILGRDTAGLLDRYPGASGFLAQNADALARLHEPGRP